MSRKAQSEETEADAQPCRVALLGLLWVWSPGLIYEITSLFSINFIYRHFHFIDYRLVFSQTPLEVLQLILSNISHSFIRNVMVPNQWRIAFRDFIAVWVWYVTCIIGDACGKNSPNMVSKLYLKEQFSSQSPFLTFHAPYGPKIIWLNIGKWNIGSEVGILTVIFLIAIIAISD